MNLHCWMNYLLPTSFAFADSDFIILISQHEPEQPEGFIHSFKCDVGIWGTKDIQDKLAGHAVSPFSHHYQWTTLADWDTDSL